MANNTTAAKSKGRILVEWLTTTDHKKIGYLYLITSVIYFVIAGVMALVIRAQLAAPGLEIVASKEQYNQLFTMHGTIMLLMFATPLFAAFAMTLPYLIVASLLGPEFPSMFGGIIGLAIVVPAAKRGFLMPAAGSEWHFPERSAWDPDWSSSLAAPANQDSEDSAPTMSLLRAWSPYVVIAVLLVITRLRILDLESVLRKCMMYRICF